MSTNKGILFFVCCIGMFALPITLFSQKENNLWYFGDKAGMSFNSGAPVVVSGSQMSTREGCSAVADKNGNLLFYTDGITVWDGTHNIMSNGTGLKGHSSSTQSSVTVKKPGSTSLYYIFNPDCNESPTGGMHYSIVDMTKNGGLGEVVVKNKVLISGRVAEKIATIKDGPGCGFWIITHLIDSDEFYSFYLSFNGIDTIPVKSHTGIGYTSSAIIGYLKGSPDGSKLASCTFAAGRLELYDFDNNTGIVSNGASIDNVSRYFYGCSFSPDSKLLYAGDYSSPLILQYDVSLPSITDIRNSKNVIFSKLNSSVGMKALQIGPDGKIYISKESQRYLGVINDPNVIGTGCNYKDSGFLISTGTNLPLLGLPNFIDNPRPFTVSLDLGPDSSFCTGNSLTIGPDADTNGTFLWNTGDTIPFITRNVPGMYWLKKEINCGSYTNLLYDTIEIIEVKDAQPLIIGKDTVVCADTMTITVQPRQHVGYVWSTRSDSTAIHVTSTQTYSLLTYSVCGQKTDSIKVIFYSDTLPNVNLGIDTVMCAKGYPLSVDSVKSTHYLWSTGDTTRTITAKTTGKYWAKASNYCLTATDTVDINLDDDPTINFTLGNDTFVCANQLTINAPIYTNTTYLWSTGDTTPSLLVTDKGAYILTVTTPCSQKKDTVSVSFNKDIQPVFIGNDTVVCNNELQLAITPINGAKYLWYTGDTTTSIKVKASGSPWVKVTTLCSTMGDTTNVTLVTDKLNKIWLGNDTSICGKRHTLNAGSATNAKYLWSNGIKNVPSITIDTTGTYWVTVSNQCYTKTDSIFVELKGDTITGIDIGGDTSLCSGTIVLDAGFLPGASYVWSTGDTTQTTTISNDGKYKVTVTTFGCKTVFSDSLNVSYYTPRPMQLRNDTVFCEGYFKPIDLFTPPLYKKYAWSDGSDTNAISAAQPGIYWLEVTDTCDNTYTDTVTISVCDCTLLAPTSFTPNGDGKNDVFMVNNYCLLSRFNMKIYSRWGEVVFETQNPAEGWDGNFKNAPAPDGMYSVIIRYGFAGARRETDYKVNVILLR
jgi:gliding motility-associated-like protein